MTNLYSWQRFESENDDTAEAFQTLARRLIANDLGIESWVTSCPVTWPGIECDPVEVDNTYHSFQAKYYSRPESGWTKLKESLKTTCAQKQLKHYELDVCHVFVNWDKPVKKKERSKATKTKEEECEEILRAAGIRLKWNYGDQILERLENDDEPGVRKLARQFFTFPDQPKLIQPKHDVKLGIAKYHYAASGRLDYVERQDISNILEAMITDERGFIWHTITGPAGVGKSRAIMEFCQRDLTEDWNWGWLQRDCDHNFGNWEPDKNTLIVVDYAMGRGNQLQQLLESCVTFQQQFFFKVRVLVAERMVEPWLATITNAPTLGPAITQSAFRADPHNGQVNANEIRPFNHDDRLHLARIILSRCNSLDMSPGKLVKIIENIDQDFRPLIAWLCANQLAQGHQINHAEELLCRYLQNQREKHWRHAGITEEDERKTAIITMCQGVTASSNSTLSAEVRSLLTSIDLKKHATVLGLEPRSNELSPMEPDIVGEIFALDFAAGKNPFDLDTLKRMISEAATLNSQGLLGFLYRAASDFPSHQTFEKMLHLPLIPTIKANITHFLILGLNKPGPARDRAKVKIYLDDLLEVTRNSQLFDVVLVYCGAVTNASHGLQKPEEIGWIRSHISVVRGYLDQFDVPLLAQSHAGALSNLLGGDRLAPLTFEEKINYVEDWDLLVAREGYPIDALRNFIGVVSREFDGAVKEDHFAEKAPSRKWLSLMKSRPVEEALDEHVRAVVGNSLIKAAHDVHEAGNYLAHSMLIEEATQYAEHMRSGEVTSLSSELFSITQKIRNGGSGNPDAYRLLGELAAVSEHVTQLYEHAYNPIGTE